MPPEDIDQFISRLRESYQSKLQLMLALPELHALIGSSAAGKLLDQLETNADRQAQLLSKELKRMEVEPYGGICFEMAKSLTECFMQPDTANMVSILAKAKDYEISTLEKLLGYARNEAMECATVLEVCLQDEKRLETRLSQLLQTMGEAPEGKQANGNAG